MKLNPKYLIYHDLIGINVLALRNDKSKSGNFMDIGTVVDETKNMLITKYNNKKKLYIKKNHMFRFILPKNDGKPIILEVEGRKIVGRPEDRIKDIKKRRWLKK